MWVSIFPSDHPDAPRLFIRDQRPDRIGLLRPSIAGEEDMHTKLFVFARSKITFRKSMIVGSPHLHFLLVQVGPPAASIFRGQSESTGDGFASKNLPSKCAQESLRGTSYGYAGPSPRHDPRKARPDRNPGSLSNVPICLSCVHMVPAL
ncbi:uncharacterized protein [Elaeis guineensis]|uniref:uncharacterized protein isoform X1 n=1 Tax=Elaeis guineensis var. tenera TaxID=51953 RepID=UPI003C6CF00E